MKFLADINVVIPLLLSRHAHRALAVKWFDSTTTGEVALCRLVRLGTLRLLCNSTVMGLDVQTPESAIAALEKLEADERISLVHEPDDLDATLKFFASPCKTTPNLWSDAYLAAFAKVSGLKFITFDSGFKKFTGLDFLALAPQAKNH